MRAASGAPRRTCSRTSSIVRATAAHLLTRPWRRESTPACSRKDYSEPCKSYSGVTCAERRGAATAFGMWLAQVGDVSVPPSPVRREPDPESPRPEPQRYAAEEAMRALQRERR